MLIKNHRQERQLLAKRLLILGISMAILMGGLIIQLSNLQLYHHARYTTLAIQNWLELVPIEPTRGLIYDRYGHLLAENIPVFSLDIIPNQIVNLPQTLHTLAQFITLSDDQMTQFYKQLKQHRRFEDIPLKLTLTEEEIARLVENQYHLPGVFIKARFMRHYPYGPSFSHVLGYVGRINNQELQQIDQTNYSASHYIGKLGIEKAYEAWLHGTVGYGQVEKDASGKLIRTLQTIPAVAGRNLYLTLDGPLQLLAENMLGPSKGAVVAIDPNNGQILAMVSHPSYDPNQFVQGMSQALYQVLQHNPDRPLFNRTLQGLYPMASTIKPYLALQALQLHIIDPQWRLFDPGWFTLPHHAHIFHDWQKHGHGWVSLREAIVSSCDTYFYHLAYKMGIDSIDDILTQFNFGLPTGIDLQNEWAGTVASPAWKERTQGAHWYPGDTILSGIGQGFMRATPLQLAVAVSILANRGKHFVPSLQLNHTPHLFHTLPIPSAHWEWVIQAMREVAHSPHGTGFSYGPSSYTIAMKTGTAQVVANQKGLPQALRDHHLLIAFAPADKPRLALAIVTENSYRTLPIARRLFDYYLLSTGPRP